MASHVERSWHALPYIQDPVPVVTSLNEGRCDITEQGEYFHESKIKDFSQNFHIDRLYRYKLTQAMSD